MAEPGRNTTNRPTGTASFPVTKSTTADQKKNTRQTVFARRPACPEFDLFFLKRGLPTILKFNRITNVPVHRVSKENHRFQNPQTCRCNYFLRVGNYPLTIRLFRNKFNLLKVRSVFHKNFKNTLIVRKDNSNLF